MVVQISTGTRPRVPRLAAKPAERQDQLARDGREDALQGHRQAGAGRSQRLHQPHDPVTHRRTSSGSVRESRGKRWPAGVVGHRARLPGRATRLVARRPSDDRDDVRGAAMKFAVHLADLSYPGGPDALLPDPHLAGEGRRPGRHLPDHDDGPLLPDGAARRSGRADARGLHDARLPRRPDRDASSWACWSPASPTATRACWPRSSPRSTCSAGVGRCWVSAPPGTSASTAASGCRSRPRRSGSSGSRRRCRSAGRCGATTTARTRASTTSSPRRSASPRTGPRRPPIMIGGSGERKTLRLVAQYADACNLFPADLATVRHKLEVLRRALRDRGTRSGRGGAHDHRRHRRGGRPGRVPAGAGDVRRSGHQHGLGRSAAGGGGPGRVAHRADRAAGCPSWPASEERPGVTGAAASGSGGPRRRTGGPPGRSGCRP